jgi:hypothetical protein
MKNSVLHRGKEVRKSQVRGKSAVLVNSVFNNIILKEMYHV